LKTITNNRKESILLKTITFEISEDLYEDLADVMKSLGATEQEACDIALQMLISENMTAKTMKMPGLNKTLKNILGDKWNISSIKDTESVT
jgi:hypothetical protein